MALLTVATITDSGIVPSLSAVSSSDTFNDDGAARTYVEVNNGGGSPITVTIPAQNTSVNVPGVGVLTVADISVSVTNGTRKLIGPFTLAYRNATGLVTINYSATTSVTAQAFKLAKED
jgi:hypothetical protein